MAQLGFRHFNEMIGRTDKLNADKAISHWKAKGLDFSRMLYRPVEEVATATYHCEQQDHCLDKALDHFLIKKAQPALLHQEKVEIQLPIYNCNRTFGAMLSGEVARYYGQVGLPEETIVIKTEGSAGQSFGAFLARGITIDLVGEANDYVGKGLSGGRLIIRPPGDCPIIPQDNIIVGNTVLYGATSGECYFSGVAGERFAVRNSGAIAVVEGVGDHGCEYMTGGIVIVIGTTGRNFAAGMSGGIAYVFDETGTFKQLCNLAMVELESVEPETEDESVDVTRNLLRHDAQRLRVFIEKHQRYTNSQRAREILAHWRDDLPRFVKVMPVDYRRALQQMQA
jgi:glutamate synthase (NADPH/NADH) large chain